MNKKTNSTTKEKTSKVEDSLHPESYAVSWGYLNSGVKLFAKQFENTARMNGYDIDIELIEMMEKMLLTLSNKAIKESENFEKI